MTVTFHENQLHSFLDPILHAPGVAEVTLVTDRTPPDLEKLHPRLPPKLLVRLFGRAGAKLMLCVWVALRERPDWVIGFSLVPHGVNALIAARAGRARAMYHMIGGPDEWLEGGWRGDNAILGRLTKPHPAVERILFAAVKRFDVIAVMGDNAREFLIRRGLPASRIVVVPGSSDAARFAPGEDEPDFDVVTVGNMIRTKRMGDVLEAVAMASTAGARPVRAALVGDGDELDSLRDQARSLGIDSHVVFTGRRKDVESFYRRSRVFVLASGREGLSGALTEAMLSGLPAVVSDVGEQRLLVEDGVTGFVVPVGDVTTLASCIRTLLGDEELRHRMGVSARTRALELADISRVADLVNSILARPRLGLEETLER